MGRVFRDAAPQERRRDGQPHSPMDLPVEHHFPMWQIQPLDAVALAAPGIGDDILRRLPGWLHGVERKFFLPLTAHIGRGLIEPERLEIAGLPVQLKADDRFDFAERQRNRWLPAQPEELPQGPVGVLQPTNRLRDSIQQSEHIQTGGAPLLALDDHIIGAAPVDVGQIGDGTPPAQNKLHQLDLLVRQHRPSAVMAAPGLSAPAVWRR